MICYTRQGFTLIEMSIVLVIIGLIVGSVLAGQSLIAAAEVRAQITQIEKYNTAANTFFGKYGYLPGDIPAAPAALFGFASRGQYAGEGDGNGIIEGITADAPNSNTGLSQNAGETVLFWRDLSTAGLIEGGFSTASATNMQFASTPQALAAFLPIATLGSNNFINVFSGGFTYGASNTSTGGDINYFQISAVQTITCCGNTAFLAYMGVTVAQAYAIDNKTDDGLPQSGRVQTFYDNAGVSWPFSDPWGSDDGQYLPIAPSPNTCFDNNNAYGPRTYSMTQNNGTGLNCNLSFRMQAGD